MNGLEGRRRGQRGSVLTSLVLVVGLSVGLFWGVGQFDFDGVFGSRADRLAAAAAAAGAAYGPEAAWVEVAGRGGALVSFEVLGADAVVTVEVGGVQAVAKARRRAEVLATELAAPGARREGLSAELLAAIGRADDALGQILPVTSGRRSTAAQAALFAARASNPYPVAPPGSSRHEWGEAIDVPASIAPRLAVLSASTGLCQPYPRTDPIHFELCGT